VNDKIEGLLAEGRALLASGRPRDAAFVFERALLLAPADADARAGLAAAQSASAEHERILEERLAAAEQIPIPRGWFALRRSDGDGPVIAVPAGSPSGRSRTMLGAVCAGLFLLLGAGVAARWDGLMMRLAQAPMPQDTSVAFAAQPGPRTEDQTIAAAQRLLENGDPARAVALLDSVHPHQPSYPFARQLRGQAERALRQPGARR
jgi:hypothetical protein